jgi:hypothetical protein
MAFMKADAEQKSARLDRVNKMLDDYTYRADPAVPMDAKMAMAQLMQRAMGA